MKFHLTQSSIQNSYDETKSLNLKLRKNYPW